jgi:hypothetical protein
MKASIAARSCATELKLAPCSVVRARIENQISTWLSQLAWVGVKWTVGRSVVLQLRATARRLVRAGSTQAGGKQRLGRRRASAG